MNYMADPLQRLLNLGRVRISTAHIERIRRRS